MHFPAFFPESVARAAQVRSVSPAPQVHWELLPSCTCSARVPVGLPKPVGATGGAFWCGNSHGMSWPDAEPHGHSFIKLLALP